MEDASRGGCYRTLGRGQTATAASVITSATIKDNTIQSKDVRNGYADDEGLQQRCQERPAKRTGASRPPGPGCERGPSANGAPGANGANGANGVTDITYVDGPEVVIPAGGDGSAFADCPEDRVTTGGSWFASGPLQFENSSLIDGIG